MKISLARTVGTLMAGMMCLTVAPELQAGHGGFHFRKPITIDRGQVGNTGAPTTLSNFPFLYSVTDLDLRTTANGGDVTSTNGFDIIFRALDSTTCGGASVCTLDHEIESYNGVSGQVIAWVRLPSVNTVSASSNTVIYIYYGNSSITSTTENTDGVWDSNYRGVWHLNNPNGGAGAIKDSTTNANHGTDTNGPTLGATGMLGNAIDFDGANDLVNVGSAASLDDLGPVTISAWINPDTFGGASAGKILLKTDAANAGRIMLELDNTAPEVNTMAFFKDFTTTDLDVNAANSTISTGAWQYVVATWDGSANVSGVKLYKDGTETTYGTTTAGAGTQVSDAAHNMTIGARIDGTTAFDGRIDEVRVSAVVRDAHWIKTEYNNQSTPSAFFTVGAEQADPPTAVSLISFTATSHDDVILLRWRTGYEVDNLGFHLYREEGGQLVQVSPSLIAGSALLAGTGTALTAGQSYSWWDDMEAVSAQLSAVRYWLEDVDLNGQRTWHGPVEVESPSFGQQLSGSQQRQAELLSRLGKGTAGAKSKYLARRPRTAARGRQDWLGGRVELGGTKSPRQVQWALAAQPAVKLLIDEEGWYRVGQPELVTAGLDPRVDPRLLQLFVDGKEQPIIVVGEQDGRFDSKDAIEFYGVGLDTPATDTRVYWLVLGSRRGKRVQVVQARGQRTEAGGQSFPFTVERKERTIYFAALNNGDAENFFGPLISTEPVEQALTVHHLDQTGGGEALLEVVLQGVTQVTHRVRISLNGVAVGTVVFTGQGQETAQIPVSEAALRNGENLVALVGEGETDVSLVDVIRLTYWHTFTADENTLRFTVPGNHQVTVGGFSSSGIRVLDVTHPDAVQEVAGTVGVRSGGFAVTLQVPQSGERALLAFSEATAKRPAEIIANQPSVWHQGGRRADYVIITGRDFLQSVEPLRALRRGLVIDVEDLYDEFSFGAKSPRALRDFLLRAREHWQRPPRFVLLVGDASVDPRDYLGFGDFDFVPTKLVDTLFLETASDDWYADFNGDGLPEMAMGRLPVRTPEEAATMVSKIINYEQSGGSGRREALLVADNNDIFDFEAASTRLNALLPANMIVHEVFRGRTDVETARREILAKINQGQLIVNYMGHGSVETWAGEGLLTAEDAEALSNIDLPFFVGMTCLNGLFHHVFADSLAEALMKAERGAVAVWAPSGATVPGNQTSMNQALFRFLFSGKAITVGEAIRAAKAAASDTDVRRTWILFGDPATRIK
jgi:hypothetical protein